jgi:hypothetical protein
MKGLTVAVMALCVAGASARIVVLGAAATDHTDQWCADHFLGQQAQDCVKNAGCCYSGAIGKCHSCTAHSDEWCATYGVGENGVTDCIAFSGCTYDYDVDTDGECVSNSDWESIVDEQTCEEVFAQAHEDIANGVLDEDCSRRDAYDKEGEDQSSECEPQPITYIPQCDEDDGTWEAEQSDPLAGPVVDGVPSGMTWCVSEEGHEIPDTSFQTDMFETKYMNCDKEQKKFAGMQCPNAVTLTTGNGETFINDNEDVGNCDVTCNTDKDCDRAAGEWCCYNGCGYSCQEPIHPKKSCDQIVLDASLTASDRSVEHGSEVTISCARGYSGSDEVDISCQHGKWDEHDMQCLKGCGPYHVPGLERNRDYKIEGKGMTHDSVRTLGCTRGYGAIAGGPHEMFTWEEKLRCINGAWEEKNLVCSTCYDAPNNGEHAFNVPSVDNPALLFDCTYFQSRPTECAKYPEARENCRISCYTCEEMNREFKVKALKEDKSLTKHPSKWLKKRVKLQVGYQTIVVKEVRTKVARVQKKAGLPIN